MAYNKKTWINGTTPLNANNLNNIEEGIAAADALSTDNENRISVIEEALKNTELSYNEDTNFINIKIAADEAEENTFVDTGVNITMKASNVSFDNTILTPDTNNVEKAIDASINGISLETKYKDLKETVTYKVSYQGRYTVTGVRQARYGSPFLIIELKDYADITMSLSQYNLTEENTLQDILNASNSESTTRKYISEPEINERLKSKISFLESGNTFIPKEVDPESENTFVIDDVLNGSRLVGIARIQKESQVKYACAIAFFGKYGDEIYNFVTTTGNAHLEFEDYVTYDEIIEAIRLKLTPENIVGTGLNVENGTGTNAIQMKQDGDSGVFDFTGKNPHATELDESLTGEIPYGAIGDFATSVGGKSSAQGKRSMSQGTTNIAKGKYSHAEGDNCVALGDDSHAEGYSTVSNGPASHSEGNNTVAGAEISHAEGFNSIVDIDAVGAHVEGAHNIARGQYSHVAGLHNEANMAGQFVVGHCNDNKEDTAFEVGCGWTDEEGNVAQRRNAFEVYLDGHAEVLTVGNTENSVVNIKALNKVYTDINEKLEGKKNTFILDCTWNIDFLKNNLNNVSNLRIEDGHGNNISQAILNGEYDNIAINNDKFNSNENKITLNPIQDTRSYTIALKATNNPGNLIYPVSETFIVDTQNGIYQPGDVILVVQTDVPDRWFAGYWSDFYALETRKFEVGATNLQNGREGTKSVQGGTDVIANYDGDIVFGTGLETVTENQAAFGKYNYVDWNYTNGRPLFTVGNGTDANNRSTAFEVYEDGHAEIKIIGSTNNSVATKLYVDSSGGTKFYKHSIRSSNIATDKTIVIINTSSNNVSASNPSSLASMHFISGYITDYPEYSTSIKNTILYKGGATFVVYDNKTSTFTSYNATGTITDTVEEL